MKKKKFSLLQFAGAAPEILQFEILSKGFLTLGVMAFRYIRGLLLWNVQRPAFTSGDIPFLMRSWQGWGLLLLAAITLYVYIIFDIVAIILMADHVLHGRQLKVVQILREAFTTIPRFVSIQGALLVFYVSIIVPLCGGAVGISLTESFTVPYFITSVINKNPLYSAAYYGALLFFFLLSVIYFLTFHYVVLKGLKVGPAMKASRKALFKNWKSYLKDYVIFVGKAFLILALVFTAFYVAPLALVTEAVEDDLTRRSLLVFLSLIRVAATSLSGVIFLCYHMMLLNIFYERAERKEGHYVRVRRRGKILLFVETLAVLAVMGGVSYYFGSYYDMIFTYREEDRIIAHRAGGTLANENTVRGLERAIEAGAFAAEIDVQRTLDGHYIINHDNDFFRTTGIALAPEEMTLEEIRKLKIADYSESPDPETDPVATIEEMLDASKDRITLLIELKGNTADLQMAEDVYDMVMERDMLDQVLFISLEYPLLDSIEKAHPEIETGYLCFMAFGQLENMNVDVLLLEEETATVSNIDAIHDAGKKVGVWTANTSESIEKFLRSDIDGIITDEVALAEEKYRELLDRDETDRILNFFSY